jgi:hypothetical protein
VEYDKQQQIRAYADQAEQAVGSLGAYLEQINANPSITSHPVFQQEVYGTLRKSYSDMVDMLGEAQPGPIISPANMAANRFGSWTRLLRQELVLGGMEEAFLQPKKQL